MKDTGNWKCLRKMGMRLLLSLLVLIPLCSVWSLHTMSLQSTVSIPSPWIRAIADYFDVKKRRQQQSTLPSRDGSSFNALEELHHALETMQVDYFQIWLGKWPTSIDWTGAVLGTFVSSTLYSLTRSLDYTLPPNPQQSKWITIEGEKVENEINRYFSQEVAYYFGEDAFSIRLQAYDDMLWVVLGWLEAVRFIKLHTDAHYTVGGVGSNPWYGNQFVPAFAHRANIFYEIASQGWGTDLCGGGMTWNPRLAPYKNAITNQLYISASISMYLYFPGDRNPSPYMGAREQDARAETDQETKSISRPHDPIFLENAVQAYDWLKNSNMTNEKGLYVDGFHVAGWNKNGSIGTGNCDVRNEMVYTYNQGVLLSGLRGLWEGTGKISYLQDGHVLVRNVMAATGWKSPTERDRTWSGLGRNGIMEEICDPSGTCSQNGQTFKGIFFHHLTLFCEPLPRVPLVPGRTYTAGPTEFSLHSQSCREYAAWVTWNARAAMETKSRDGRFGMWWGAPHWKYNDGDGEADGLVPQGAEDYRNQGLGSETRWGSGWREGLAITPSPLPLQPGLNPNSGPAAQEGEMGTMEATHIDLRKRHDVNDYGTMDLNDRGRGRTVETQGGGVAVLRAMWEFVHMYAD